MSQGPVEVPFQTVLELTRDAHHTSVMAHATDITRRDRRITELEAELASVTEDRDELAEQVDSAQARIRQLEGDVDELLEKP